MMEFKVEMSQWAAEMWPAESSMEFPLQLFVQDAKEIWNNMKDLREKQKIAHYMTHDGTLTHVHGRATSTRRRQHACVSPSPRPPRTPSGYLKLWQLQVPKPQLSDQYDVIMIDEAQDCSPGNERLRHTPTTNWFKLENEPSFIIQYFELKFMVPRNERFGFFFSPTLCCQLLFVTIDRSYFF